jgi:hypothetical protein
MPPYLGTLLSGSIQDWQVKSAPVILGCAHDSPDFPPTCFDDVFVFASIACYEGRES